MAFLYRFEVCLKEKDVMAIIAAANDEEAFKHLDVELEKFYLHMPEIVDVTLREKKRIGKNTGFILDEDERGW
ncbi:DUF3906 domain-containing protein [Pradoshia eiseniae]|uniref:DUF3906 domain-containing protein n=1 Tax=Pradoshia eiseniae TaxID=2064768 RepID=A0A2S7MYC3_9BACI|nr:DUF3906 family protein [Pradoshia eiseniae]PQD94804.1 DUF3906 domain-containing protein [Pradoshia eiseniae]